MMPLTAYTGSRRHSRYHVQVEIEDREVDDTPAHVPVTCTGRLGTGGVLGFLDDASPIV